MEKRVVITGLGAVTPVGIGKENFYNALLAGQSGIGPITRFDASDYATRIAGEVKDFDITNYGVDKKEARRMDRSVEFAIGAAVLACEDADLDLDKSTYPKLLGLSGAKQKAQDLYQSALSELEKIPFDTTALRALAEFIITRKS